MTTNLYMGIPFGCLCVLSHLLMVCFDRRPSFGYYNLSLLLWVTGNFLWMTCEFVYTTPSSKVHIGPQVPLGDINDVSTANFLVEVKTFFFLGALIVQIFFYCGILFGHIIMPGDDDTEVAACRSELHKFLGIVPPTENILAVVTTTTTVDINSSGVIVPVESPLGTNRPSKPLDGTFVDVDLEGSPRVGMLSTPSVVVVDLRSISCDSGGGISPRDHPPHPAYTGVTRCPTSDDTEDHSQRLYSPPSTTVSHATMQMNIHQVVSLAFVENVYIVFWICKDFFWSWGTGDFTRGLASAIVYESFAIFFGMVAFFVFSGVTYLYRANPVRAIDALSTALWLSANFSWMTGEFFLRYRNLQLDDGDEGDDGPTRMASVALFSVGIALQGMLIIFVGGRALLNGASDWRARYFRYRANESVARLRADSIAAESGHGKPLSEMGETYPDGRGRSRSQSVVSKPIRFTFEEHKLDNNDFAASV